ncbi:MAG: putative DNA modification/repair radical SAM protein [Candidatus Heimdallarchaeaceae archaeon]
MPSIVEKLQILGEAAKYDLCASSSTPRAHTPDSIGRATMAGVCHSFLPDGRCISLLKVLVTNGCIHDCKYCINSTVNTHCTKGSVTSFEAEELANLTMSFYLRNYIEGLFLSSGIVKNATTQAEIIYDTLHLLRNKYKFGGYIHAKVLPGIGYDELRRISELADRVSINVELPNKSRFEETCSTKSYQTDILKPMNWLPGLKSKGMIPAGYTTQYVISGAEETDEEILDCVFSFYNDDSNFKRQYYSTCLPLNDDKPLPKKFFLRENRLYQIDWLYRIYEYSSTELQSVVDDSGFIPLNIDPKISLARNSDIFPLDVNNASYLDLIRVPGLGPTSAKRILSLQKHKVPVTRLQQLKSIGVVLKRALPFLSIGTKTQLTLEKFTNRGQ